MNEQPGFAGNYFLRDIAALREHAGRFLHGNGLPQESLEQRRNTVELLQTALAAEIVCVLRYTKISISTAGLQEAKIGAEFQAQANDERRHMEAIAKRIAQLGGAPDFAPDGLISRATSETEDEDFAVLLKQNLLAEQQVIEHYHDLVAYFSERDPTTRKILEDMLRDEENHTEDMQDLLITHGSQSSYKN